MTKSFNTIIVGFGSVAQGYGKDPLMEKHYEFSTHAKVLSQHQQFNWVAIVDPGPIPRKLAVTDWGVSLAVGSIVELGEIADTIDVAVLAVPPSQRAGIVEQFPNLKAVIVEKPLGESNIDAESFVNTCRLRGVSVQVNLWRRADSVFSKLATGELQNLIGKPLSASVIYGNGLANNGTHMIDMSRMFFGEPDSLQLLNGANSFSEGPLPGDINLNFSLNYKHLMNVTFHAVSFDLYRENSLVIWGENGRLEILNEGLIIKNYKRQPNRATLHNFEISSDRATTIKSTVGTAFFRLYDNLAEHLLEGVDLISSGDSALKTSRIVYEVINAPATGERVKL